MTPGAARVTGGNGHHATSTRSGLNILKIEILNHLTLSFFNSLEDVSFADLRFHVAFKEQIIYT